MSMLLRGVRDLRHFGLPMTEEVWDAIADTINGGENFKVNRMDKVAVSTIAMELGKMPQLAKKVGGCTS